MEKRLMTAAEFYQKISSYRISWTPLGPSARLRLGIKGKEIRFCPITAVCYLELGLIFMIDKWQDAARAIGLSDPDSWAIMYRADDVPNTRLVSDHPLNVALRGDG